MVFFESFLLVQGRTQINYFTLVYSQPSVVDIISTNFKEVKIKEGVAKCIKIQSEEGCIIFFLDEIIWEMEVKTENQ